MAKLCSSPRTSRKLEMYRLVGLLLIFIAVAGCGDSTSYRLAHVAGTITLDGKPLPRAVVTFQPISTGSEIAGPGSVAHCDEEGKFVLQTIRDEAGAVVGQHRVIIFPSKRERIDPAKLRDDVDDDDSSLPVVPARYNYESILSFDVPVNGTETADFALTSQP
jgi:hypothetical protein